MLAPENITLDSIFKPKSTKAKLPSEPKYEEPIGNANKQTEKEANTKQPIKIAVGAEMPTNHRSKSPLQRASTDLV